jgi:hypothetical protein
MVDATVVEQGARSHASEPRLRTIGLRADPSRLRRWHWELAARIAAGAGSSLTMRPQAPARPLPASVELLLSLERLTHRLPGPRPSDKLDIDKLPTPPASGERPDLTIDLSPSGESPASGSSWLRPLYDGSPDEAALMAALLDGRAPLVEIEDETGRVRARGVPSLENAGSLCEAVEEVAARVATLMTAAVRRSDIALPAAVRQARSVGTYDVAGYALRALAFSAARRLYRLCCHAPHWRVGWRFVGERDVWASQSLEGTRWSVLPDPGFRFYADPFPITWRGRTHLFVEDLDHRTGKGVISAVEFDERGPKGLPSPVLEEPWHLSYPFLMEHGGEMWMIPESSADASVSLYRADPFPHRWVKEATLLSGMEASDATIVEDDGRFWMFATIRDGAGSHSDTLCLFTAPGLLGPWRPHPANPVLVDGRSARPAGHLVRRGGRLWRPVQDCSRGYGSALGLAEILRLDFDGFEQVVRTVISPGPAWPGRRLHTLNRAGTLECIDGSAISPKLRPPWVG